MNVIPCEIPGLLIIEPKVFGDARGFFMETWNQQRYARPGLTGDFVQDNISFSRRGILRGLAFSEPACPGQAGRRCCRARCSTWRWTFRRSSPTFGSWHGLMLSGGEQAAVLHPARLRPRLCRAQRDGAVPYKCTEFYSPTDEVALRWNDPEVGIEWPLQDPLLSEKDAQGLLPDGHSAGPALPVMTHDRPRILVIGKIGQVGWELRRTLAPLAAVTAWTTRRST